MQYLYHDGDLYHFMDTSTYDQIALDAKMLDDAVNYLKDGMNVIVQDYNGEVAGRRSAHHRRSRRSCRPTLP